MALYQLMGQWPPPSYNTYRRTSGSRNDAKARLRDKESKEPEIDQKLVQELKNAVIRTNTHFNHKYHREGQAMGFYPSVEIFINFLKKEVKSISKYEFRYVCSESVEMAIDWGARKVTAIRFEPTWSQTWEGPLELLAKLNQHMELIDLDELPIDFSMTKELAPAMDLLTRIQNFKF